MKDSDNFHLETLENNEQGDLSPCHREFLLSRHGKVNLVPLPSEFPADPLNWPSWRKNVNIALVSFHAMMCLFMGAVSKPRIVLEELGLIRKNSCATILATYLNAVWIATYLVAQYFLLRRLQYRMRSQHNLWGNVNLKNPCCIFHFPSNGLGHGCCDSNVDGDAWSPTRPLFDGICCISCRLALDILDICYCKMAPATILSDEGHFKLPWSEPLKYCNPETYFTPEDARKGNISTSRARLFHFGRVSKTPLKLIDFLTPLTSARHHIIWIITAAYTIIFNFAFVLLTVEIPQIFGEKFHFNTQQIGLQFLGMIIGGVLGEQAAGPLSDFIMNSYARRHHEQRLVPEFRLWLSYLGYATVTAGFLIWGFRTADIPAASYEISPIVGIGISSFGAQIITTSVITYMVDCYPGESAEIGVFANAVRQIWGFIGPFWFPSMFETAGIKGSAGIMVGVSLVASFLPVMCVQMFGARLRGTEHGHSESMPDSVRD
ncbi:hypothetical protein N7510_007888 [Penicillium lagena]|uniref:uncharacterized protein n=1 Tax=Penicillium lagena TaxID=94218 RepID=UPI002541194F|nr:uncharacterized protein N7510_007888 [Penicillium lagena]KAJ5611169.1 hypothetical protein N7510_007888 [Penicillium lagena]